MTKHSVLNKNDKRQLLIETSQFISKINLSTDLKESVKLSGGKTGTLIVKNVPCTILNRVNQNGRIYTTEVVQAALNEAVSLHLFEQKQLLSQADEHPKGSFVAPSHASHVVINAYIKPNVRIVVEGKEEQHDVLFMDWEVLNTQEGKNLRALLEAECSVGTSIRGVGDLSGKYVENYSVLGVDIVGNPSSSTYTRMPVSESVQVELKDPRALTENFTVSTSSTNVVRDLEAAARIQEQLQAIGYGTVTKTSTKVDEETDPKTGAQTSITTLEAETSDDVADLDQALMMAKNAMLNGTVNVDSITIENIKEEEPKESAEVEYAPLKEEEKLTEAAENKKEEDPNEGKKFVLKTPAGFVAMDGNALVFKEDPKEALHFIVGKEESGLVHLSGVEKILDTMGVYDVEKYYRKEVTDLSTPNQIATNTDAVDVSDNANTNNEVQENSLSEDNGSNTRFTAKVSTEGPGGAPEVTSIPVSGTEMSSIVNEVSNLWQQKSESSRGHVDIWVMDTQSGVEYMYDPTNNTLQPVHDNKGAINPNMPRDFTNTEVDEPLNRDTAAYSDTFPRDFEQQEAVEPVEQDKNKLTVNVDDDTAVEKEFENPVQASVAKAGLEQGKLSGDVMLDEKEISGERPQYEDIEPGWYAAAEGVGVSGPFATEQEAWAGLEDVKDLVTVEYISPEDIEGIGAEVAAEGTMEEKLFKNASEPSDPYVDTPLNDSLEEAENGIVVRLSNIDWDVDSLADNFSSSEEGLEAQANNLPNELEVKLDGNSLEDDDAIKIKQFILDQASKQAGMKVNDATILSIE